MFNVYKKKQLHSTLWKDYLIGCCKNAYKVAVSNTQSLPPEVLQLEGMSGHKTRQFYNHLCSNYGIKTYVEIGSWKGSSIVSALYNNTHIQGVSIDNWSEFGGPIDEFHATINRFIPSAKLTILNKDCWSIDKSDIPFSIDVLLYDGGHTYELQKKAITHFYKHLSKFSILLIDDWTCDWVDVRKGTYDGIMSCPLIIHYSKEIGLVGTSVHHTSGDTFWNGMGVFVVERTDI